MNPLLFLTLCISQPISLVGEYEEAYKLNTAAAKQEVMNACGRALINSRGLGLEVNVEEKKSRTI